MKKNILTLYGVELNENLGKCKEKQLEEEVVLNKGKYISNNAEFNLENKPVDLIESYGETYFLQHAMNAFGSGAKISDWKNSRLIGKAYICLSLIFNNMEGVSREPVDIDHVTVLFDSFNPKNLKTFGSRDLSTWAENNSTDVHQYHFDYLFPSKVIVDKTDEKIDYGINEYTVLRENEDGSIMYPCGIKVTGEIPTQAEIDAAAYLGVPLIKLHKTKNKKKEDIESIKHEMENFKFGEAEKNNDLEILEKYLEDLSFPKKSVKR